MYTSALLVALTSLLAPSVLGGPVWQTDYDTARKLGREGGKPLAVFIGSGKAGWNQLTTEGQLSKETKSVLSEGYVCLYVDVSGPEGKRLASKFDVDDAPGLILSDSTARLQAFRHEGDLADEDLVRKLQKYVDPEYVVQATEGERVEQVSYFSAEESQPAPAYYPGAYYPTPSYYPSFGGGGGRGC